MSQKYDNSGAIYRNDTEGKSENFPGYGGSAMIDGVEYWISAWVKDGAKGRFFSLAFKPKEERQPQTKSFEEDIDDSIPF